mmetsp:Transcript_113095/g.231462  ORF Transcript_113095/g.231462 Transcript_113095/m.231462 type:complete len:289 (-) Transcript_113095:75-941(-)
MSFVIIVVVFTAMLSVGTGLVSSESSKDPLDDDSTSDASNAAASTTSTTVTSSFIDGSSPTMDGSCVDCGSFSLESRSSSSHSTKRSYAVSRKVDAVSDKVISSLSLEVELLPCRANAQSMSVTSTGDSQSRNASFSPILCKRDDLSSLLESAVVVILLLPLSSPGGSSSCSATSSSVASAASERANRSTTSLLPMVSSRYTLSGSYSASWARRRKSTGSWHKIEQHASNKGELFIPVHALTQPNAHIADAASSASSSASSFKRSSVVTSVLVVVASSWEDEPSPQSW